jgi:hypothetical protein
LQNQEIPLINGEVKKREGRLKKACLFYLTGIIQRARKTDIQNAGC